MSNDMFFLGTIVFLIGLAFAVFGLLHARKTKKQTA